MIYYKVGLNMFIKDVCKLDADLDRLFVPMRVCLEMLQGMVPEDCTLIDSVSDKTNSFDTNSVRVDKIFYYDNSAWWVAGIYSFDTKRYQVLDFDTEDVVEDLNAMVGLPGIVPGDTENNKLN